MRYTTSVIVVMTDEVTGTASEHVCSPQVSMNLHTAIQQADALVTLHGPYYAHDAVRATVRDKYGRERWTMEVNRVGYLNWMEAKHG